MNTPELYPFQYFDGIIHCESAEDRQLLQDAVVVVEDSADAKPFTSEQFQAMSEACGKYGLTNLQQVVAQLAMRP